MIIPFKKSNLEILGKSDAKLSGWDPEIDSIIHKYYINPSKEGDRVPGCALGIVYNNKIAYLKGYGYSDLTEGQRKKFDTDTISNIGSISKTLTSLGILKLYEENRIESLNDRLSKYLAVTQDLEKVTIKQLLTHTSGLPQQPEYKTSLWPNNEADLVNFLNSINVLGNALFGSLSYGIGGDPTDLQPSQKLYLKDHPGKHPKYSYYTLLDNVTAKLPPTTGSTPIGIYSNIGYALLGAVIDRLQGDLGYEKYILNYIGLDNGKIKNSKFPMPSMQVYYYWRYNKQPQVAKCYKLNKNSNVFDEIKPYKHNNYDSGWFAPAGGWCMTIGDLTRLMLIIQNSTRITDKLTDEMLTKHSHNSVSGDYGYGVQINYQSIVGNSGNPSITKYFGHAGGFQLYEASFRMFQNLGIGIAILTNSNRDISDGFYKSIVELLIRKNGIQLVTSNFGGG